MYSAGVFWQKVMHLDHLNVGRGPTYDWIYCAAGTNLDSQVGQKEYWKTGGPQPIKRNNPFWRLAPTDSLTMPWAERHYWTSNGPYKPYGDHGYTPRPNFLRWSHHIDPAWVDGFTVERMLHEWTYSGSRQYPFICTLGGLSGQSPYRKT